ncbi:synaptotagmin 1 [Lepeophtheirus salmonis]|uniref:Synaptotagmin 1 [Tribolium castaneum] n=1 Tax=Lepeophtheirus salmonis TaxID=72036 RepID=A0A0K2TEI4_LEPSM|nr:synaptotagmin 1-like [Lepeophtheirus salmonis]XP_040565793.1 synaptotagmin 1-like [Lepeophtheirus salmonis]XP_040565794.1 synaptotagmin 1-like [Lepeophtheirus salmonis]
MGRIRRDAPENSEEGTGDGIKTKAINALHTAEDKVNEGANFLSKKTNMQPWMWLAIFAAIVLVILGICGWCIYRFCKKKRPKGASDKKDDDENALVENEEAPVEDLEEKKEEESRGRIRFRIEYDFTTQELKVTVIECADLPPTDWSTGLTDPFVKVYLLPDKKPKYETKVHRKNLNPKFDQTFIFKNIPYVDTFDKTLVFAVYDYDRFSSSDQTGEYQLPMNSVDLAGPIEEWRALAPVDDGSNQYLGDLCLSLRYVPSSGKLTVAILEARKLKKMDITGASDPYVKIKLFDSKGKRIGKKKKTSVKSCNLNPYWNESFVFLIDEMDMKRVFLDITVCDYDLIGGGDPIGKVKLGWNQQKTYKPGFKHFKEVLENPRRPIIKWHVLQDPEPEDDDDKKKEKDKKGKDDKKDDKKDKKDEKKEDKKEEKKDEKKK